MELTGKEIIDVVLENNATRAGEILEAFGFTEDNEIPLPHGSKTVMSIMLGIASAMSYRGDLDGATAKELIERTATSIDIFSFLRLVAISKGIEGRNFDTVPKEIRTALSNNEFSEKIARMVEELDEDAFASLVGLIASEDVESIYAGFNLPIIWHIYTKKTILEPLMFAYMNSCPRNIFEAPFPGLLGILDITGALSVASELSDILGGGNTERPLS